MREVLRSIPNPVFENRLHGLKYRGKVSVVNLIRENQDSPLGLEATQLALSPLLADSFTRFIFKRLRNCLLFSSPHEDRAATCAVVVPNNGFAITPVGFVLAARLTTSSRARAENPVSRPVGL